jgi:hypothetical protein
MYSENVQGVGLRFREPNVSFDRTSMITPGYGCCFAESMVRHDNMSMRNLNPHALYIFPVAGFIRHLEFLKYQWILKFTFQGHEYTWISSV